MCLSTQAIFLTVLWLIDSLVRYEQNTQVTQLKSRSANPLYVQENMFHVHGLARLPDRNDLSYYFITFCRRCLCVEPLILYCVAGRGAMAEVSTIVSVVRQYLQKPDESSEQTWTCTVHSTDISHQRRINMMTGLLNELNLCLPFYLTSPPPLGIVWVCTDSLVSLLFSFVTPVGAGEHTRL